MSDVKAAAERLREYEQKLLDGTFDDDDVEQREEDLETCGLQYLREHALDDDEPVTEEWGDSVFPLEEHRHNVRHWVFGFSGLHIIGTPCEYTKLWKFRITNHHGQTVVDEPTRVQVRQLCKALGIELNESQDP